MLALKDNLQKHLTSLDDFKDVTIRVLDYLPAVVTRKSEYSGYVLSSSTTADTTKRIRPYHKTLFIADKNSFIQSFEKLNKILKRLRRREKIAIDPSATIIDSVLYTIQQSIGMGLDLTAEPNSSRKHVGNRFEELIKALFDEIGIASKKIVLNIPYTTDQGDKHYRCETDLIISPFEKVKSSVSNINLEEIVITLKTTTKDRMPKIFIDKILMERFVGHEVKIIGISLNDIQRKNEDRVASTFVSNLFMVYTEFLTQLEGYYYLDMPTRALEAPFNKHVHSFSAFLLRDIWDLLRS